MVFQAFNLFPHLTVLENVVLAPVRAHGVAARARPRRARASCSARFGLAGPRGRTARTASPAASSSAWRSCARSPRSPRALLLDEVTSALDPELVGEVLELIRELKAEGMTMLIATHEMGFAREVADEVCFLHDGAILERGAPGRRARRPAARPRRSASCRRCPRRLVCRAQQRSNAARSPA